MRKIGLGITETNLTPEKNWAGKKGNSEKDINNRFLGSNVREKP